MAKFTHLHIHSYYSILTATATPAALIKKAKEFGMDSLALTDHSSTYGLVEFYKAAKKEDMHPILGCDINILVKEETISESKTRNIKNFPIVLLAETYEGYQNILELSTKAHLEGFYDYPCIDHKLIKTYGEGIIALIGSKSSVAKMLLAGEEKEAKEYLKIYKNAFGNNNIFIELDYALDNEIQDDINKILLKFSKENNVGIVASHPVYYASAEDSSAHDVLLCIRDAAIVHDDNRYKMEGDYSMISPELMEEYFKDIPEAIENTNKIKERCNVELPLGQSLIPSFETPNDIGEEKYLRELCEVGLKKRYGTVTKELQERLDYELGIIHSMGFDAYFLIVWDFVDYSKKHDIMVGPGRGSAAGSIVAYTLEITDIDPIYYGLIFERFLNPDRVSMPDIDIDFIDTKRDRVIKYVQEKYGSDKVAQIITFGTMAARGSVRDCGRALGYGYSIVDRIAKAIPGDPGIKLKDALKDEVILQEIYKESDSKKILDAALKLEGCIRNTSIHAAALVIAKDPLTETTALQEASKGENSIVTQYSMKPIEELGLLKMDFLGLRNLSILENAINTIKELNNVDIDLLKIPLDDKKTYEMLSKGETTGVFQFESPGMRKYLKDLNPTCVEDLIAMVSLYRPGPMEYISEYISGKKDPEKVKYLDPCLESILSETYGIAVYQEQIQKIAQIFAGYTLGEADILRRAMGKKKLEVIQKEKSVFVGRAMKNGKTKELAEKIFSFIEPFARYGFNKAHAASYATISYQTAYLKANYPVEYMSSLLTADGGNADKIIAEVADCLRMDIKIVPPSINFSQVSFSADKDKKSIIFALSAIKNIGESPSEAIIEARKDGKFESIGDFVSRMDLKFVNKKILESLAKAGALDEFAERNQILENIDLIIDFAKQSHKNKDSMQIDLFASIGNEDMSDLMLPEMVPASLDEKLAWEKELMGVYVSSHPLEGLKYYLNKYTTHIDSINDIEDDTKIRIGGIITSIKTIITKGGDQMAFITIEDQSASIDGVIFARTFEGVRELLEEGNIIVSEAKVTTRERNDEKVKSLIINKCRLVDLERARKMKISEKIDLEKGEINEKGIIKKATAKELNDIKHFTIVIPQNSDMNTLERNRYSICCILD